MRGKKKKLIYNDFNVFPLTGNNICIQMYFFNGMEEKGLNNMSNISTTK